MEFLFSSAQLVNQADWEVKLNGADDDAIYRQIIDGTLLVHQEFGDSWIQVLFSTEGVST